MTQAGSPPFPDLGMTQEKYALLGELAEASDYWVIARALVNAAANLELSSLSDHQRRQLTSIILELDNELYRKSWGLDKMKFEAVKKSQWRADGLESSFDKMRRMLAEEGKK